MKRVLALLLTALVLLAVFSGCQKSGPTGAEFILGNGAEPEALDPHLIEGVPEHRIYMSLFEGLTTMDPKTGGPVPGLAESWERSSDGLQYTFTLRDAVWSDGTKITAQTVVDSWLRGMAPETASPYAWFPNMFIDGAEAYNSGEAGPEAVQIRALDDKTFQIDLIGPLPYVVDALTHYSFAVVPMHVIEEHGEDWTKPDNFVGNGPFVLDEWKPQESLSVVPNDEYWNKESVKLSKVTYLPVEDNNTAYNMFLNGEIDWITEVPLDMMDQAKQNDDYHVAPYLGTYYYLINNDRPPFDDPRVRKALAMAFDREELVTKVAKAGQIPAYSFVPTNMAGYPGGDLFEEDLAEAKRLLAEAGFPEGEGFPEFEILYNTSEGHKKIAEYIQQAWNENLGIQCNLFNQEWKTYLATRRTHDFAVARAGWIGDYQDPNTFLDMFLTGGAGNDGLYANPNYDEAIKQAATMADGPDRFEVLRDAESYFIEEDMGVIPIYFYVSKNMVDTDKWGGWFTNVRDYHPPKDIYLKE